MIPFIFSLLRYQGSMLTETYKEPHIQMEGKGKPGFVGTSLYASSIVQKVKHIETILVCCGDVCETPLSCWWLWLHYSKEMPHPRVCHEVLLKDSGT